MHPEDLFERAVKSLHDAALDDAAWLSAAARINEASGAEGHALVFAEGRSQHDAEICFLRFCYGGERRDDWERRYVRDYWASDERVPRLSELPDGALVPTPALYAGKERTTSPVYNEILHEMQGQNGLNLRLEGPGGSHIVWILADCVDKGGWGSDRFELIRSLRPHVRQFMCVRQALVDADALGAALSDLLDNTLACAIQLDRSGRIVEANDASRDVLRRREGVSAAGGFLRATSRRENTELQRLLERALPPFGGPGVGGSMAITRYAASPTLILHIIPVGAQLRDSGAHRVAALVLLVDPLRPVFVDPGHVAMALDLTPTESRVASMLAAGIPVSDVAAEIGRAETTVRWHIQRIFRKQGIRRQTELVRRVLALQTFPGPRGSKG